MWGDPWGGWAFGSRYLIPAYAVFAILVSVALSHYRKNILFLVLFASLFIYSVAANLTGALTSIANPPEVEAEALGQLSGRIERFSWDRNWESITNNHIGSFAYNEFIKSFISPINFYWAILIVISILGIAPLLWQKLTSR
jgi:hypothetical protein